MRNANLTNRFALFTALATVTLLSACTAGAPDSEAVADPAVGSAEQELSVNQNNGPQSGTVFPETGNHIRHKNTWDLGGQPAKLNVVRTTEYPVGNSSIQFGDQHHYWSTLAGQVVGLTTTPTESGHPSKYYLYLNNFDGYMGAQTALFGIGDNIVPGFAWMVKPAVNGTTSMQYGPTVTQATIDIQNAASTLQIRSGATNETMLEATAALGAADRGTAMLIRRNSAGAPQVVPVTQADNDSCGAGFRCLRVPNN
jgi:hypothetical protein